MKHKFQTLLGCLMLMLFALCFTVPAQAEDNSPPQTLEQCDQLAFTCATFEVTLSAPVSVLSPQSVLEVPGDVGYNDTDQADWPPGNLTAQAIKFERKTLPGSLFQFDYRQHLRQSNATNTNLLFGTDIDRWCSLSQNFYNRALLLSCSGHTNQTTRHVLRC